MVVNLTSKDSITLPEAQFMLQAHELRLENFHSASALDLIAAIAQISLNHNNFHNTNQSSLHSVSPRGSFCSSQGHNWQGMTSFHGKGSRNSNLRLHCQICGQSGHWTLKCYHRFDLSFVGNQQTDFRAASATQAHIVIATQAHIATPNSIQDEAWYLESGATHHTTHNSAPLKSQTEYHGPNKLIVGNGSPLSINHVGQSHVSSSKPLYLRNILLVLDVKNNLISISQFTLHNNIIIEFDSSHCYVKDKLTKEVLVQGQLTDGLYQLNRMS